MSNARNLARVLADTSGAIAATNLANAVPADGSITNAKLASGAVTAAKVSGALAKANMASGTILQALQATNATDYTISGSGDFVGLSITITPTASNSRFLLIANIGQLSHSGGGSTVSLNFSRNGSSLNYISGGSYNGMVAFVNADTNAGLTTGPTITFIDTPATASAVTYKVIYSLDGTKWVGRRPDGFIRASQQFQVLEIAG